MFGRYSMLVVVNDVDSFKISGSADKGTAVIEAFELWAKSKYPDFVYQIVKYSGFSFKRNLKETELNLDVTILD